MARPTLTVLHVSDFQCGRPFIPAAADAMLRVSEAVGPDLVVASGDLTQRAKRSEFAQARAVLDRFGDVPVVVTPGNHDVPLYRGWERLFDPYRNWRRFAGAQRDTVTRIDGAVVVALDSSAPRRAVVNGRLDGGQLAFAERAFAGAIAGDVRILVVHHHFVPVPGGDGGPPLPGAARLVDRFDAMGVDVVLGGHVHQLHLAASDDVPGRRGVRSFPILSTGTSASRRGRGPEMGGNSLCVLRFAAGELSVTPYRRGPGDEDFRAEKARSWTLERLAGVGG